MTIERWIEQARRGDAAAFNHLAGHFQSTAYHVALHHVGSADDALDACQEALISAWRAMDKFEGDAGRFRAWLMRIVINACRDRQRYEARRPSVSLDTGPDGEPRTMPLPDPGESPEHYAANADLGALMEGALAQLSSDHREAILLDQAGFSYQEIAFALGVEVGTVKSRLSRGRSRLRDLLTGATDWEPSGARRRSRHMHSPEGQAARRPGQRRHGDASSRVNTP